AAFFAAVSLELAAAGLEERLDLVARRRRAAGARDVDGRGCGGEVEGRLERTSLDMVERPRQSAGAEQLRDEGRVENVSGADRVRDHGDGTGRTRDRPLRRVQHGPVAAARLDEQPTAHSLVGFLGTKAHRGE